MFESQFRKTLRRFTQDEEQVRRLWDEVHYTYSSRKRYYHTMTHLDSIISELLPVAGEFSDWNAIVFATGYHDIVYNVLLTDNEEKSARLAEERLESLSCPAGAIAKCAGLIRATQKHEPSDHETNLFTDADLSILGAEPERYRVYLEQIRKEYRIYPDFLYYKGRKKVLHHFLGMPRVFKTRHFYDRYELRARMNLRAELDQLKNSL
jgi:predicted metal-dependent HD superfamily phosphohydrolase